LFFFFPGNLESWGKDSRNIRKLFGIFQVDAFEEGKKYFHERTKYSKCPEPSREITELKIRPLSALFFYNYNKSWPMPNRRDSYTNPSSTQSGTKLRLLMGLISHLIFSSPFSKRLQGSKTDRHLVSTSIHQIATCPVFDDSSQLVWVRIPSCVEAAGRPPPQKRSPFPICSLPPTGTEGPMPMADTAKGGAKAPKRNGGKKAAKKAVEAAPTGVCV